MKYYLTAIRMNFRTIMEVMQYLLLCTFALFVDKKVLHLVLVTKKAFICSKSTMETPEMCEVCSKLTMKTTKLDQMTPF